LFAAGLLSMWFTSPAPTEAMDPYRELRRLMVEEQIKARGIKDPLILQAMLKVPREKFVPPDLRAEAYGDHPLPIGNGQTISQPYIVAYMTEKLRPRPGDKILEIGTGSGYQTAILAEIGCDVYTVELLPELSLRAQEILRKLGYENIHFKIGNGYRGWPEEAPFDGIIVTAAPPEIPEALKEQLKVGGRMVIPAGETFQNLYLVERKSPQRWDVKKLIPVSFVPMVREN